MNLISHDTILCFYPDATFSYTAFLNLDLAYPYKYREHGFSFSSVMVKGSEEVLPIARLHCVSLSLQKYVCTASLVTVTNRRRLHLITEHRPAGAQGKNGIEKLENSRCGSDNMEFFTGIT